MLAGQSLGRISALCGSLNYCIPDSVRTCTMFREVSDVNLTWRQSVNRSKVRAIETCRLQPRRCTGGKISRDCAL
jgi:hypothetical protein